MSRSDKFYSLGTGNAGIVGAVCEPPMTKNALFANNKSLLTNQTFFSKPCVNYRKFIEYNQQRADNDAGIHCRVN